MNYMRAALREAIEALHLIAGGNESEIERPIYEIVNDGLRELLKDGVTVEELMESFWDRKPLEELQAEIDANL